MRRARLIRVAQHFDEVDGVCACQGDSQTAGFGVLEAERWTTLIAALLGGVFAITNIAESGRTVGVDGDEHTNMIEDMPTAAALVNPYARWSVKSATRNLFIGMGGVNDTVQGRTGAELIADVETMFELAAVAGFDTRVACTIVGTTGAPPELLNAWLRDPRRIRSGLFHALADLAANADLSNRSNTTLYQEAAPNGTHWKAAGHVVVAPIIADAANLATGLEAP